MQMPAIYHSHLEELLNLIMLACPLVSLFVVMFNFNLLGFFSVCTAIICPIFTTFSFPDGDPFSPVYMSIFEHYDLWSFQPRRT